MRLTRPALPTVAAATLFVLVATVGAVTRDGFDLARHAISMLSLGEHGWAMALAFMLSGALTVAAALGLRAVRRGRPGGAAVPLLVGTFGVGLVLAGIFPAPAGLGFPPGTPADLQPVMTPTAIGHALAFNLAFSALIAAAVVQAVAEARQGRVWLAVFSALVAFGLPLLIALGMAVVLPTGVAFYAAAVLAWAWLAVVAVTA